MAYVPLDFSSVGYFSNVEGFTIFPTLNDAIKNLNVLDDEKILSNIFDEYGSNVIPYSFYSSAPELTGGLKTGNLAQSLEKIEDTDEVKSSNAGVLSLVKADSLVYSVLNALGVNVTPNDTIKEKIASALSTIYNKVITATAINTFAIPVIVKNDITFIPQALIKKLSDALYELGLFSKGDVEVVYNWDNIKAGRYSKDSFTYTNPFLIIKNFLNIMLLYSSYNLIGINDSTIISILNDFYNRSGLNADELIFVTLIYDRSQNRAFLKLSKLNSDDVPISVSDDVTNYKYHSSSQICYTGSAKTFWQYIIYYPASTVSSWAFSSTSSTTSSLGYHYTTEYYDSNVNSFEVWGCNANTTIIDRPAVEGIDEQVGADIPKDNDIDIQTKYANWSSKAVDIGFYNPTIDSIANGKLLPIDLQGEKDATLSTTWDKAQADVWAGDIADDVNARDKITEGVNDAVNDLVNAETGTKVEAPSTPTPPNPPTPTPSVITSVTSAGLATIYNPTESQVQALKGELWQESVLDILKTLFANNPLDCIISLHRIYCTPSTSGTATIKLGYYQSSVSGVKIINNQYVTIDCGTVNVPEIYGNATDYLPYTNISIYLPFIGIRELSANDIVGGSVNVIYRIDVTTGVCLAQIDVTKNGIKQTLYAFDGNCAVTVPLSSANMLRLLGGMTTAITGAVTGNVLGTVAGLGASLGGISVQKSGNFSSNAGAMGIKKPYLIINRHIPYDASEYNKLYGYPSNKLVKLSTLNGFTRVKDVHVEGIACTDNEKILIENALKDGVFL